MYKYWKVICRYGHVGLRNEVSVSRYLQTDNSVSIIGARHIASQMPGVKSNGVLMIVPIDENTYILGKQAEKNNIYILALKNHKQHQTNKRRA